MAASAPRWSLRAPITNRAGEILVPKDIIHVTWSISGEPAWDYCYVSVSSFNNPLAIVMVMDPYPLLSNTKPAQPWSTTDKVALAGLAIAGIGCILAVVVGYYQIRDIRKKIRDMESSAEPPAEP
ncbi:MAG: hypothetical protein J3R72DRAFT_423158 [Linnemannia gamsii]|nr:MAG: hypothetical protein J3R72DRAFT_423158 [Linnemannia gamsii]